MIALVFRNTDILLRRGSDGAMHLPAVADGCGIPADAVTFSDGGEDYIVLDESYASMCDGDSWTGLRDSWQMLSHSDWHSAAKGAELAHFSRTNRFCGSCGSPLLRATGISRRCPKCGREIFPSLSPAVIVLVTRGEEALLVHAKSFSRPFYALVAGFVETGETLEECVAREILEESSLHVSGIRYFGSQSWPFPAQLMLGFTARYESGSLRWADGELADGGFFSRDSLPMLPSLPSISRRLIDAWIEGKLEDL